MSGATLAVMAVGVGMQAYGSYQQSQSQKAAYKYQSQVNANNAKIAEWQAQDALTRGAKAEQQSQLKTAKLRGSQRAALAANGVALDEGSPLSILQDTDYMGGQDVATIHGNAAKEAWSYRNQGAGYASDSDMLSATAGAINPAAAGATSLLTGGGQVADSWYRHSKTTSGGGDV